MQVIVLPKQYMGVFLFFVLLYSPEVINFCNVLGYDVSEKYVLNSLLSWLDSKFVRHKTMEVPDLHQKQGHS